MQQVGGQERKRKTQRDTGILLGPQGPALLQTEPPVTTASLFPSGFRLLELSVPT